MTLVLQRGQGDCGVSALAMITGHSYEDTYVEVVRIDPRWRGKYGLFNREMVVIARRLGVTLTPTKRIDLDRDTGVLRIRPNRRGGLDKDGHFIALVGGHICCPLNDIRQPWREYLDRHKARACTLLKVSA